MRQQVVDSECDSCHRTDQQPLATGMRRGHYVLPKGWMHVQGVTSNHTVFEVDLCTECKMAVMESVGKGRRLRAVSESA
jgi:hypothetical protein